MNLRSAVYFVPLLLAAHAVSAPPPEPPPPRKPSSPFCQKCQTPGRMAFLRGLGGAPVALATAVDEKTVSQWLARQVIDPQLPLAEVKVFTETRVPNMPRVRNAAEWRTIAAKTRRDVLDKVVFTGGAAQWRNKPLKVEWLDTIEDLPGYRIKKLRFECLPGWWIPALLYEPAELANKVPVVLNVNGHSRAGMVTPYKQERCINLAKRGMLSMNVEWIGMGQFANRMGHYQMNQLDLCGTPGIAPFYLNMSKALDVLLSHPKADPKRVAVAGLSGGGWQTIFISSLDPRVTLANPVAGYSSFKTRARHGTDLGDSEQTPNNLAVHADYTHLTAMMADRAALLTYNAHDNCCFAAGHALPPLMDAAAPMFSLLGRRDQLRSHINYKPGDHNFGVDNRQQLYRFIGDMFYPGQKFDWREIPSQKEIQSKEKLFVPLPKDNLSFNAIAKQLAAKLPRDPTANQRLTDDAKRQARLASLRRIVNTKDYALTAKKVTGETKAGFTATYWQFAMGKDWTVPAVELSPAKPTGTTLLIADTGRKSQSNQVKTLLSHGQRVIAIDPFFFGESKINRRDFLYVLLIHAVGERALGIQSSQVAAIARWVKKTHGHAPALTAVGPRLSVAARIAAAQEPAIASLELYQPMASLKEVIEKNRGANHLPELMCYGLLKEFDLPQIEALIAPRPVAK